MDTDLFNLCIRSCLMRSMHTGSGKIKELACVGYHSSSTVYNHLYDSIRIGCNHKRSHSSRKGVRMVVSWTRSSNAETQARIGYTADRDNQLLLLRIDMAERLSFRLAKELAWDKLKYLSILLFGDKQLQ